MEALGRLAGRDALPRLLPHLYDADPALRNAAIRAVVAIEQRATAAGESLDPRGAGRAAPRRTSSTTCSRCSPTTTRRTAARPRSPWAG